MRASLIAGAGDSFVTAASRTRCPRLNRAGVAGNVTKSDHGDRFRMTDFSELQLALSKHFEGKTTDVHVERGNELHCRITRGAARRLAGPLRMDFGAELALMVANDRPDKRAFEVNYLFANARENWFVHATKEVAREDPAIVSLATFYFPGSRYEREIKDLFGIEAIGHPDPRPLVRHAFWPKNYFPLRKGAVPPEHFEDDGTPFPFYASRRRGGLRNPCRPSACWNH